MLRPRASAAHRIRKDSSDEFVNVDSTKQRPSDGLPLFACHWIGVRRRASLAGGRSLHRRYPGFLQRRHLQRSRDPGRLRVYWLESHYHFALDAGVRHPGVWIDGIYWIDRFDRIARITRLGWGAVAPR